MRKPFVLLLAAGALLLAGCDRSIEPYDPNEQVEQPDLKRIFPEGAARVAERERAQEGGPMAGAPPQPMGGRGATPVAAEAEPIAGTMVLTPELEGQVPADAILFLVARKPGGGPPIAVQRIPNPKFPLPFEIGPGDRMIQSIPFEGPLLLSARVDGDGNATSREPGDLQGAAPDPVDAGATGVTIRIDTRL